VTLTAPTVQPVALHSILPLPLFVLSVEPVTRILKRAGIGHRSYKDLRDTYASSLLTAGVQLGYVSAQLGHADVVVTARHYAKWIGGDVYREPFQLRPGDVPADFIARSAYEFAQSPPSSPPSELTAGGSNLLSHRPLLRKLAELRGIEPLTLRLPVSRKPKK
jgi:hypothetical protein